MSERLLRSLREAVLTLVAMLGTLACTQWLEPGAASGALGVVLSLSLARSHLAGERRGAWEALLALPLVSLASVGVGALLHVAPWTGATLFVAAMGASIWMRRFGPRALRLGSLIALPLVTILVVPRLPHGGSGALPPQVVAMLVALLALAWVLAAQALGRRLRWIGRRSSTPPRRSPTRPARCARRRPRAWRCRWPWRSPRRSSSATSRSRRTGAGSC